MQQCRRLGCCVTDGAGGSTRANCVESVMTSVMASMMTSPTDDDEQDDYRTDEGHCGRGQGHGQGQGRGGVEVTSLSVAKSNSELLQRTKDADLQPE